eukprot:9496859-Alexandrium_andersonii.AAC.1
MDVNATMLRTGCPAGVVTAYASYMESLRVFGSYGPGCGEAVARPRACLLYTSDAADEMQCVDLG